LAFRRVGKPNIVKITAHIGTSGWQYGDWRGTFYPEKEPTAIWLELYARSFCTVEVNNTFYRLPPRSTFEDWRARTPSGFELAIKASRYLTHLRRLRDPQEPVDRLLARVTALGPRTGPLLLQLPPNLRIDVPLLECTLDAIGSRMKTAVEFRHRSWFTDEVLDILDRAGAALVLADRPRARIEPTVTGGWSYLRFHQGTQTGSHYPRSKLRRWADVIAGLEARDIYVYFNNDQGAAAPRDASALAGLLSSRGLSVPTPAGEAIGTE
jgi:uncharacterized protein YecE (DUF72 family)